MFLLPIVLAVPPTPQEQRQRVAVILRCSRWLKYDVIAHYLTSLRSHMDFWVLYDNSMEMLRQQDIPSFYDAFDRFASSIPDARAQLVVHTNASVFSLYNGTDFESVLRGRGAVGWLIHVPFINAWRREYGTRDYRYYWVVEDDARLTGDDYGAFFDKYDNSTADFLSAFFAPEDYNVMRDYNWLVPERVVRKAKEHVQRYSPWFLNELHVLHTLGLATEGEFFAATACNANPDCIAHDLADDDVIGSTYRPAGRMSPSRWRDTIHSEPNKWFHALKWLGSKRTLNHSIHLHHIDWPTHYLDNCDALRLCCNEPLYKGMDSSLAKMLQYDGAA